MGSYVFPSLRGIDIKLGRSTVYATMIQGASSGKELRASWQAFPRHRYTLQVNFARQAGFSANTLTDEVATLQQFFDAHLGQLDTFLITDPVESTAAGMGFGVGDGTTVAFQLQKASRGKVQASAWDPNLYAIPTTPRTNLLLASDDMSGVNWSKNAAGTGSAPVVTANYALAPDGSTTADRVVMAQGAGSTIGDYSNLGAGSSFNPGTYTFSIWLKSNTGASQTVLLRLGSSTQLVTVTTAWQRFSVTRPAGVAENDTTGPGIWVRGTFTAGGTTLDLLAWGAQHERGDVPTPNISTSGAAVTVTPKFYPLGGDGFEPTQNLNLAAAPLQVFRRDWQGDVLMSQLPRTNLVATQDSTGTKSGATVAASPVTDPKGTTTAQRLTDSSSTSPYWAKAFTTVQSGAHTLSIWIMGGSNTTSSLAIYNAGITTKQTITSAAIVSGPGAVAVASDVANITGLNPGQWTKLTLTVSSLAAATGYNALVYAHTAGGTAGTGYVEVFGWQVEFGTAAGSWIPTSGATATVTDITVDGAGKVTFSTAPLSGAVLTWSGAYYTRVRFEMDEMSMDRLGGKLWDGKTFNLISTK